MQDNITRVLATTERADNLEDKTSDLNLATLYFIWSFSQ